jgi:hypothetical protein
MSYDIYFINKTKKEIVSSKQTSDGFEDNSQLIKYLSGCINTEIMIIGESHKFVDELKDGFHSEYKFIKLYEL